MYGLLLLGIRPWFHRKHWHIYQLWSYETYEELGDASVRCIDLSLIHHLTFSSCISSVSLHDFPRLQSKPLPSCLYSCTGHCILLDCSDVFCIIFVGDKAWCETQPQYIQDAAAKIMRISQEKWKSADCKNEIYRRHPDADSAFALVILYDEMLKATIPTAGGNLDQAHWDLHFESL